MVKISSNKPTPVVVVKEKVPTMTADIKGEVVTILPEALQEECQLVSRLKREVVMTLPKTLQEKGSQRQQSGTIEANCCTKGWPYQAVT